MPLLKNGDYSKKLSDGRKIVFGIRNGRVCKIGRAYFSDTEFREALAEARKALFGKSSPKTKKVVCPAGAYAHDFRNRKMLPDF